VDPATDDPERLSAYADALGADPARWWFLTGSEQEIYGLVRSSFLLAVERSEEAPPGERVTHATRLAVVDGEGEIRGTFDGMSEEGVRNAQKLALRLAAAPRP
jgi:protein SCO1/2